MRKENYGHPQKVSWTRSSRTDKGVHSLCTVLGLKMHCFEDSTWDSDPEGLTYAAAINECVSPGNWVVLLRCHMHATCFARCVLTKAYGHYTNVVAHSSLVQLSHSLWGTL